MRLFALLSCSLAWSAGLVVACGTSDRPGRLVVGMPEEEAGTPSFVPGQKEAGVPRCDLPTAEVCDCVEMPLATEPPNVYFVLDHSGSMAKDDLWKNTATVVLGIVRDIGSRAKFGAAMFPSVSSSDTCATGKEIMSVRQGDKAGTYGPVWTYLHDRTIAIPPAGGTPLSATLTQLTPTLTALSGKTFVVLATDGGPNCNTIACTTDECIPNIESAQGCTPSGPNCCLAVKQNCLDSQAARSAVKLLSGGGIPVYVVGVPGSAPYASLLDDLATLGGTAQTGTPQKYYRVDAASQTALSAQLRKVAAKIVARCEIDLTTEPTDPNKVNVYLDQVVLPKADDNGWTLDGKRVTLTGTACDRVKSGDVLDVRVVAGCSTIAPK